MENGMGTMKDRLAALKDSSQTGETTVAQMSLEDYKKRALDYLNERCPDSTEEENRNFLKMSDEVWRAYMEDFSPEVMVQGLAAGLI